MALVILAGCRSGDSATSAESTSSTLPACQAVSEPAGDGAANWVGLRFPPDVPVTITITHEDGSHATLDEGDLPQLRTDARGRFELTNMRAGPEDIGLNRIVVEAGGCIASFSSAVPPDLFGSPPPT